MGQAPDLRGLLAVLRRYRQLIVSTLCLFVSVTALVVFSMEPSYTATATIDIERDAPNIAPVQGIQAGSSAYYDDPHDYYETQYQILKNRALAARVIHAMSLDTDPSFVGTDKPGLFDSVKQRLRSLLQATSFSTKSESPPVEGSDQAQKAPKEVRAYLGGLTIEPVRNSRLVRVSFASTDPRLAAAIANQHVDQYMQLTLEQRLGTTGKAKEFLETEVAKARDRVVAAEGALNKFRKDHDLLSVDGDKSDIVSERLVGLNEQFTQAQGDRIRLEGQYELIEHRAYESLPDVAGNPAIAHMKQEAASAAAERSELEKKYKPGYPRMAALIAREQQLRAQIADETRKVVEVIRSGYLAAKNRELELARRLEEQRQAALRQKDSGADFGTLKRDVETARSLYANLLQRTKDLDVAKEVRMSNISIIEPAVVPTTPLSPNRRRSLLFAVIFGLATGVGLAFALDNMDNTVKNSADLEVRLGLPALGIVPAFDRPMTSLRITSFRDASASTGNGAGLNGSEKLANTTLPGVKQADDHSIAFITKEKPSSVIAEAYRAIRTAILLSTAERPPQVILFTSGASGEGKTITTVNQALTLGQSGAKVLLLDADVRRPRLHRLFGLPNGSGLTSYLAGQSPLDSIVYKIDGNGAGTNGASPNGSSPASPGSISVVPSGPMPPNPAELLGSERMRELLDLLRKDYDYILLDTPPVLPVTDAVVLSQICDGVVIVVRGQKTPIDLVAACRDRLLKSRARIIGAVLNALDLSTGEYEKHYRYYYSYYAEDHHRES